MTKKQIYARMDILAGKILELDNVRVPTLEQEALHDSLIDELELLIGLAKEKAAA